MVTAVTTARTSSIIPLWIAIGVLTLIVVSLIIYSAVLGTRRIDPSTCPRAVGEFGVRTRQTTTILRRCNTTGGGGGTGTDPCVFTANDLKAAIDRCDVLIDICDAFVYNSTTRSMAIVDTNTPTTGGNDDLYTRQFPRASG